MATIFTISAIINMTAVYFQDGYHSQDGYQLHKAVFICIMNSNMLTLFEKVALFKLATIFVCIRKFQYGHHFNDSDHFYDVH